MLRHPRECQWVPRSRPLLEPSRAVHVHMESTLDESVEMCVATFLTLALPVNLLTSGFVGQYCRGVCYTEYVGHRIR